MPTIKSPFSWMPIEARKINLNRVVLLNHASLIIETPALYNCLKTKVTMTTIEVNTIEFYWEDVLNGERPSRMLHVYVTFVSQAAVNCSY